MIEISVVSYLNSFPFIFGLKNHPIHSEINLHQDIPSVCARKLLNEEVAIGLIPVAILPNLKKPQIISDFCISAEGEVDSVKLFSECPVNEIEEIILDYQSRTSVKLVQVLCAHWWKINPQFTSAEPGFENQIQGKRAAVVIGDRTFSMNGNFPFEYDLSLEWKKMTGLPFVFAVWASNQPVLSPEFLSSFNEALSFGLENLKNSIKDYKSEIKDFDPHFYLTQRIKYNLNDEKRNSINKFLSLIS